MLDTRLMMGVALAVSTIAAVTDLRSSTIPNWLTLPVLMVSPLIYALANGPSDAMKSVASALACGLVPYVMFRLHAMGGGDVKLLASLGAATGVDPWLGLHIEALSFVFALGLATSTLAVRGQLLRRLRMGAERWLNRLRPETRRTDVNPPAPYTVRMGLPILAAATLQLVPHAVQPWTGS